MNPFPLSSYTVKSADVLYTSDYPRKVVVASLNLSNDSPLNGVFGKTRTVVIKWTTLSQNEEIANCEICNISGIVRCFSAFSGNFNLKTLIPQAKGDDFYEAFSKKVNAMVSEKNMRNTTLIDQETLRLIRSRVPPMTPQESVFFLELTKGTLDNDTLFKSIKPERVISDVEKIIGYLRRLGWCQGDVRLRNIHIAQNGDILLGDFGKAKRVGADQLFTDEKMSLEREIKKKVDADSTEGLKPKTLRFD